MGRSVRERIARWFDPLSYYAFDYAVADCRRLLREQQVSATRQKIGAEIAINHLKFLLASAPLSNAPSDPFLCRFSRAPFAYVHPKTLARLAPLGAHHMDRLGDATLPWSPTRWIPITLMPEEKVIYSASPLPGTEKWETGK